MTQRITSIRFTAKWTEPGQLLSGGDSPSLHGAREVLKDCTFHLGRGPCGKTVTKLEGATTRNFFCVNQHHDDDTSKSFYYKWDDILGRIEFEEGPGEEEPDLATKLQWAMA